MDDCGVSSTGEGNTAKVSWSDDALYFFILATCAFFAIGVSIAVVWFGIKYHRTHEGQIGARIEGNLPLEKR